ncbi:hypothetical protein [Solitalea lacus]
MHNVVSNTGHVKAKEFVVNDILSKELDFVSTNTTEGNVTSKK